MYESKISPYPTEDATRFPSIRSRESGPDGSDASVSAPSLYKNVIYGYLISVVFICFVYLFHVVVRMTYVTTMLQKQTYHNYFENIT